MVTWKAAVMRKKQIEKLFDLFLEPGKEPPEDLENYPGMEGWVLNRVHFDQSKKKVIYRRSTVEQSNIR